MEWMIDYVSLDAEQREFVDSEIKKTGNIWIKGHAGSGKSILLIHALKKKLNESPNAKICVVVYTHSLIDMFNTALKDIGINGIPVMTYFKFKKQSNRYDFIFCDEVQDLPADVVSIMYNRCERLYVAGDANQSIYEGRVSAGEIVDVIKARPYVLTRIHRLTASIINAVSKLSPLLNIFSAKRNMTKKDVQIRLCEGDDEEEEVDYIWKEASKSSEMRYSTVILLPKHVYIQSFVDTLLRNLGKPSWNLVKTDYGKPDYSHLNSHLLRQGVKIQYVGSGHGSFNNARKNNDVVLMTYHSVKGMDFENVFLPFMSDDLIIPTEQPETLMMVAMTRSKQNLFITYSGDPHRFVERFSSGCQKIDINNISSSSDDFDF